MDLVFSLTAWSDVVPDHRITTVHIASVNETTHIFTGSVSGTICLWRYSQKICAPQALLVGHQARVTSITSCSEDAIISFSEDGSTCLWHVSDGRCLFFSPRLLDFSPLAACTIGIDGDYVAVVGRSRSVAILHAPTDAPGGSYLLSTLGGPRSPVHICHVEKDVLTQWATGVVCLPSSDGSEVFSRQASASLLVSCIDGEVHSFVLTTKECTINAESNCTDNSKDHSVEGTVGLCLQHLAAVIKVPEAPYIDLSVSMESRYLGVVSSTNVSLFELKTYAPIISMNSVELMRNIEPGKQPLEWLAGSFINESSPNPNSALGTSHFSVWTTRGIGFVLDPRAFASKAEESPQVYMLYSDNYGFRHTAAAGFVDFSGNSALLSCRCDGTVNVWTLPLTTSCLQFLGDISLPACVEEVTTLFSAVRSHLLSMHRESQGCMPKVDNALVATVSTTVSHTDGWILPSWKVHNDVDAIMSDVTCSLIVLEDEWAVCFIHGRSDGSITTSLLPCTRPHLQFQPHDAAVSSLARIPQSCPDESLHRLLLVSGDDAGHVAVSDLQQGVVLKKFESTHSCRVVDIQVPPPATFSTSSQPSSSSTSQQSAVHGVSESILQDPRFRGMVVWWTIGADESIALFRTTVADARLFADPHFIPACHTRVLDARWSQDSASLLVCYSNSLVLSWLALSGICPTPRPFFLPSSARQGLSLCPTDSEHTYDLRLSCDCRSRSLWRMLSGGGVMDRCVRGRLARDAFCSVARETGRGEGSGGSAGVSGSGFVSTAGSRSSKEGSYHSRWWVGGPPGVGFPSLRALAAPVDGVSPAVQILHFNTRSLLHSCRSAAEFGAVFNGTVQGGVNGIECETVSESAALSHDGDGSVEDRRGAPESQYSLGGNPIPTYAAAALAYAHPWGVSVELDTQLRTILEIGGHAPVECTGLVYTLSKGIGYAMRGHSGVSTLVVPSVGYSAERFCLSPYFTAQLLLTAMSIVCAARSLSAPLRRALSKLYTEDIAEITGFAEPSIGVLVRHVVSTVPEKKEASRLLLKGLVQRMSPQDRRAAATEWLRKTSRALIRTTRGTESEVSGCTSIFSEVDPEDDEIVITSVPVTVPGTRSSTTTPSPITRSPPEPDPCGLQKAVAIFVVAVLAVLCREQPYENKLPPLNLSDSYVSGKSATDMGFLDKRTEREVTYGLLRIIRKKEYRPLATAAIDLIEEGLQLWRHRIRPTALIRAVFRHMISATAMPTVRACHRILLRMAAVAPTEVATSISAEALRNQPPEDGETDVEEAKAKVAVSALKLLRLAIEKHAKLYLPEVPVLVDLIVHLLNPAAPIVRERCLKVATALVKQLIGRYPTVGFHQATQLLAMVSPSTGRDGTGTSSLSPTSPIFSPSPRRSAKNGLSSSKGMSQGSEPAGASGTQTGGVAVIFDMRSATAWCMLEAPGSWTGPSAIAFEPIHGQRVATYCGHRGDVRVWRVGWSGLNIGSAISSDLCIRSFPAPKVTWPKEGEGKDLSSLPSLRWTSDSTFMLVLDGTPVEAYTVSP